MHSYIIKYRQSKYNYNNYRRWFEKQKFKRKENVMFKNVLLVARLYKK